MTRDDENENDGNLSTLELSSASITTESEVTNPSDILKKIKLSNVNRLVIGHININSLRNKFESLKILIKGNIDLLVITESKLDESFPTQQFAIDGFTLPYRCDRNEKGGGVIIYVREDIPCRELTTLPSSSNIEGIFLEINLRKSKWFVFGGYNHNKLNIDSFLGTLGPNLDHFLPKFDNFLLLGDFNSETHELSMREFCDLYNLQNLITRPTCFKNPFNPSVIDLILTNKTRSFQNSQVIETGLSDYHKMTITVLRAFFQKQSPICIKYRDYKKFDVSLFYVELYQNLCCMNITSTSYELFESTFLELLNKHVPMKEKYVRANNAPFMNKTLSKAIMTRSRLRNRFLRNPDMTNKMKYNKQRNYCVNLLKKEKRRYYKNLDLKVINDNKKFWKTMKPLFSDKHTNSRNITLIDGEKIISNDTEVAEIMNGFFSDAVSTLGIKGYQTGLSNVGSDKINDVITNFKDHPSILKIKQRAQIKDTFTFSMTNVDEIMTEINNLNINKPTTFNNIPAKLIVETNDICSPFICRIFNDSIINCTFPDSLKMADVTPVHKKDETTIKDNYRPISILPCISKIFERLMHLQISRYMDFYLSEYLCGFRKGYSTQHCLILMLEKWRKALDNRNHAGALLTDLSKAFDCLNHGLLIAKLDAYGFNYSSLALIFNYLSDRKQRTKVNNSFSTWSDIKTGVPQGSILGPLLFNIYLNDIFFFVNENNLTNYADDNTPYAVDSNIDALIDSIVHDTSTLIKWFNDNYFKMNIDKCHLLVTNHEEDVSALIEGVKIECKKSVKLLGIYIDNKLDFDEHISKICKKVSLKLHALSRISHFLCTDKLRTVMKAFIESQFEYCPLIWMFHSRTLNNRINRLHERALRLAYKDSKSTFEELLDLDKSFTIHHRNLQKLVTEIFKVKNNLSPSFMKGVFPDSLNPYNLRNGPEFKTSNIHTVANGTETITFRGPKTWSLVPDNIKNSQSLSEFKAKIKLWKPEGCTCRICKVYIANLGFIN